VGPWRLSLTDRGRISLGSISFNCNRRVGHGTRVRRPRNSDLDTHDLFMTQGTLQRAIFQSHAGLLCQIQGSGAPGHQEQYEVSSIRQLSSGASCRPTVTAGCGILEVLVPVVNGSVDVIVTADPLSSLPFAAPLNAEGMEKWGN